MTGKNCEWPTPFAYPLLRHVMKTKTRKSFGVQNDYVLGFLFARYLRNCFTGLGWLGNICRNSGVRTERQPALRGTPRNCRIGSGSSYHCKNYRPGPFSQKNSGVAPSKPNQRKGQNEKFMNVALFCELWCFSLGKQARFTYRTFVPESPCEKFMN